MIQIQPFLLWVGHAGDCRDIGRLGDAGIEAVVQLAAEEAQTGLPRDMLVLRIPLHDGAGNNPARLRLAVEVVSQLLTDKTPTLVCCSAGASRSPAIAACALALFQKRPPSECLKTVHSFRSTDLSPGLWQDLLHLYG
jgi:protein-tyrosine phosphatase